MKKTILITMIAVLTFAPIVHAKTLKETLHSITKVGIVDVAVLAISKTVQFTLDVLTFPFELGEKIADRNKPLDIFN